MKAKILALLVIVGLLSISCSKGERRAKSVSSDKSETIISKSNVKKNTNGENYADEEAVYREKVYKENLPKIPLPPNLRVLQTINANLDLDLTDEQILIVKDKKNQDSKLRIIVVDFDPIRNVYFKSWEGVTNAVNPHDYSISLKDIVGDHSKQIILQGTNAKGELTLDVFRRTPSPNGLGLFFKNICKIVSDGTIDIQEEERSEGYQLGQKNGVSFPIVVFAHDPESKNVMDLLKMTYYWKYPKNSYVLSSIEKIPGKKVEEKRLRKLFNSNSIKAFEDFIKGAWYHPLKGGVGEILFFQPDKRIINLYSKSVDEVYIWKESSSKIYNRLRIVVENESIPSIKKLVSVRIKSLYEIYVSIQGHDRWDFSSKRYVRLPVEMEQQMVHKNESQLIKLSPIKLKGLYTNTLKDVEVNFMPPHYTWTEKGKKEQGGFVVFNFGGKENFNILQMMAVNRDGLVKTTRSYLVKYKEVKQTKELKRTIDLIPIKLEISGFSIISPNGLKLIQVEYIDEPSKEQTKE